MLKRMKWLCAAVLLLLLVLLFVPVMATSTWQQTGGPEGGYVQSMVMDPTNPQTLYAGTWSGGVFKTANGGVSWRSINSGLSSMIVYSLAISPANPQIIYAGTEAGIFKSTNGGDSWEARTDGFIRPAIRTLVIPRTSPQTIYAASRYGDGVFKSTNGGESWSAVNVGLSNTFVLSLAVDPNNPSIVYAGTDGGRVYGSAGGVSIFRSINGGASWDAVDTGLSDKSVVSITIDPNDTHTVYAGTWVGGGVYKTTNDGTNWSAINNGIYTTENLVISSLGIDPNVSQNIYLTTNKGVYKTVTGGNAWMMIGGGLTNTNIYSLVFEQSNPEIVYVGTGGGGVFKSSNGGNSWGAINSKLINSQIQCVAVDPNNAQIIYSGTPHGLYKSTDGGVSWKMSGTDYVSVLSLAIAPKTPQIVYATTNGRGILKSMDGGNSWSQVGDGISSTFAIDPNNNQILYKGVSNAGVHKSIDGGVSWNAVNNGLPATTVNALAIDPDNSLTLYAGTYGSMYKTTDGGSSWTKFDTGLALPAQISSIVIDPRASWNVYVATAYGKVYTYSESANCWNSTSDGLGRAEVRYLNIDPQNPETLYAVGSLDNVGVVFKSTNRGGSWNSISNGLPNTGISSLAVASSSPNTLYIGTAGCGVFKGFSDLPSPTISGTPLTNATIGKEYTFTPATSNAASFSITGTIPPGLSFDTRTGTLSGTPTSEGPYSNLVITAFNVTGTASLPAFTIVVHPSGTVAVPTGYNVTTSPLEGRSVTFSSVSGQGTVSITPTSPPVSPPNFRVITGASYSITSTASYSGDIIIGLKYSDSSLLNKVNEDQIKMFHHNGRNWEDVTTSIDTVNKIVYGKVTSLSPFILAEPTIAIPSVPVGGLGISLVTMISIIGYGVWRSRP